MSALVSTAETGPDESKHQGQDKVLCGSLEKMMDYSGRWKMGTRRMSNPSLWPVNYGQWERRDCGRTKPESREGDKYVRAE